MEVRQFVENIGSIRQSKINKILEIVPQDNLTLKINSICAKELEQIRLFLTESFIAKYESLTTNYIGENLINEEGESNYLNSDGFI